MKIHRIFLFLALLGSSLSSAQVNWDDFDIVFGDNPTLRYGYYTDVNQEIYQGRFYFIDDGKSLSVRLAPYGLEPIDFLVEKYDRNAGDLVLTWIGSGTRQCELHNVGEQYYYGNCIEDTHVMPISIRPFSDADSVWQGSSLEPSEEDLAILDRTVELMAGQSPRNRNGDRVCVDDILNSNFSVFCALFQASIDVHGSYMHRRPAMRAARSLLIEKFPGTYLHPLRDLNNRQDVSDSEIVEVLQEAKLLVETSIAELD